MVVADVSQLTSGQAAVVEHPQGTLRVFGPAGSGKTTALLTRALQLARAGADPGGILIFVHDRHQAIELRDRFVRALGRSVAGPSVFTFHAFAWSLLTRSFPVETESGPAMDLGWQLAGLADDPVLLTAFDQRALVRRLLEQEDPSDWPVNHTLLTSRAFAGEVRDFMLRAQERLHEPADVARIGRERGRDDWVEIARFYGRYLQELEEPGAFPDGRPRVDFARVLERASFVLRDSAHHPQIAGNLAAMYPHVLVDDFEEASFAERFLLESLLPGPGDGDRSAVIAGDPEGSVFAFRGADPRGLLELEAPVVTLDEPLRTRAAPEVALYSHVTEEARGVVYQLRQAWSRGTGWGDMAVIVRDFRALLTPLRREMGRLGIPHHVDGESLQLSSDPVVGTIVDLFSLACRLPGHEELWPSLLASELGGLAAHELVKLRRAARLAGVELHELPARRAELEGLEPPVAAAVDGFCALVEKACRWAETLAPDACFWELWSHAAWFERLVAAGDQRRLDSLTSLADALARFTERRGQQARMTDFLETVVSAEFAPESIRLSRAEDSVTITTAHHAKGREFAFTVVAGCVEGIWPDPQRRGTLLEVELLDGERTYGDRRKAALAEEYRLFRLATTRGRAVAITGQRAGGSERTAVEPSRFLSTVVDVLPPVNAVIEPLVLTEREAEIAWRRVLADTGAPGEQRAAALWGLQQLGSVDPARWWWGRPWTPNDRPVVGEYRKTSYSRFSNYENCPLNYLMGQVLGLDPDTSFQMAFGRLIHELLEDLEKGELPTEIEPLMEVALSRWRDEDFPSGAVANYLKRNLREILQRYLEVELGNGHQMLATEHPFTFELNGWTVRGKIDRIDRCGRDGVMLADYKTGGWETDTTVQSDPPNLQLSTYLLACLRDPELAKLGAPRQAALLFLQYGRGDGIARATLPFKDTDDGKPFDVATEERIAAILQGIEQERFAPSPDANCRYCKFKPLCPMWPEGQELKLTMAGEGAS